MDSPLISVLNRSFSFLSLQSFCDYIFLQLVFVCNYPIGILIFNSDGCLGFTRILRNFSTFHDPDEILETPPLNVPHRCSSETASTIILLRIRKRFSLSNRVHFAHVSRWHGSIEQPVLTEVSFQQLYIRFSNILRCLLCEIFSGYERF